MSIADGQKVEAATDNAGFLSRKVDSDTVGKIDLKNPSSTFIFDIQKVINDLLVQTYTEVSLAAAATISSNDDQRHQVRRIKSTGGNVAVSTTPFGTSGTWRDGTIIELVGTDNNDFVNVTFNDVSYGAIVHGDIELKKYVTLILRWDAFLIRWIEQTRNS